MSVPRPPLPIGAQAALGWVPGLTYVSKFGYNSDCDCTSAAEDIWEGGGLYAGFPTGSAETVDVYSSSTADTAAGTGMRTILLNGLDANYEPQTETITLNGTTHVTSANTWTRINRCPGQSAGSGATNAGIITVAHTTTTSNVFAKLQPGTGQTQISAYTIPADKTGAFIAYRASASNAGAPTSQARIQVAVYSRVFGSGIWRRNRSLWCSTSAGISVVHLDGAITFSAKTDLVLRAESGASADNLSVTASMGLFLVNA